MDRHRGSGYRNISSSNYSSSSYGGRNFDNNQQHRRGQSNDSSHFSWSNERNTHPASKEYDRYSSSDQGTKRRYEQSVDHKKSYVYHGHDQEPQRKYHRSNGGNSFDGRSNHHLHHRPHYEQSPSSNRGRNLTYENSHHDHDPNQSHRRVNENRRYQQHGTGSTGCHRGSGGFMSSRGRGRGRGANRNNNAGSHSKTKDYQSEKNEDSVSPNRLSIAEESVCPSEVPSISPSRQPLESNIDATSDKNAAAHSESDKSTREQEGDGHGKAIKIEMDQEQAVDSKEVEDAELSIAVEAGKKSETERSPKRKVTSKEFPDHFIKLQCPHCNQRSVTFREYILHLSSPRHEKSLEKISLQHRMSLAKLRTRQRKEQLQIEAQTSRSSHKTQMNFCAICKLCHSESRPNHEITELHKIIKNFLMPYCPICRVNFKSRMLYEKHVATLTHIKNKVNMEKSYERRREEERKHERDGSEKDELLLDLENFMTLDAVGSVDGDADNGVSLEENAIGQECVKKVEAFFCELCQRYLSRVEPLEKGLEFHCRTRSHHRAYEERGNGHKELEGGTETEETVGKEGLKRSESQELLLVEAEKDIGEMCDLIGDDEQVAEENGSAAAIDSSVGDEVQIHENNQEHSNVTEITTSSDTCEHDNQSTV